MLALRHGYPTYVGAATAADARVASTQSRATARSWLWSHFRIRADLTCGSRLRTTAQSPRHSHAYGALHGPCGACCHQAAMRLNRVRLDRRMPRAPRRERRARLPPGSAPEPRWHRDEATCTDCPCTQAAEKNACHGKALQGCGQRLEGAPTLAQHAHTSICHSGRPATPEATAQRRSLRARPRPVKASRLCAARLPPAPGRCADSAAALVHPAPLWPRRQGRLAAGHLHVLGQAEPLRKDRHLFPHARDGPAAQRQRTQERGVGVALSHE